MNELDRYSVLFWKDRVFIDGRSYPLGQCTTDVLNIDETTMVDLVRRVTEFDLAAAELLEKKDLELVKGVQEKYAAVLDILLTLPPYRDLRTTFSMYPFHNLATDSEKWTEAMTEGTEGNTLIREFLRKISELPKRLHIFREQIALMLLFYFEDLRKRGAEEYAEAYVQYFEDMRVGGELFCPDADFVQAFTAEVNFVPMLNPDNGKPILAEQTRFDTMHAFLYTDFYRGLIHGYIPRRCHNCGRYFLLLDGYNAVYCNNIAPGETAKTCRKVGAHKKEKGKREDANHPERAEHRKAYGRVKTQHTRGKVDDGEWNALIKQALAVKEMSERGEIDDYEMRQLFDKIGRE